MQAIILAAGMGSRIRDIHSKPKGLITLGSEPIIQESIRKLKAVGIHDILIVTGYCAADYVSFANTDTAISTVFNPDYHCYNSLYSLYCARYWVRSDFLLLESDIIFQGDALVDMVHSPRSNVILLSGQTNSTDEVYVEARDHKLIRMSKQRHQLNEADIKGEFVGISKLSFDDYHRLIYCAEQDAQLLQQGCYDEHGLVEMTNYADIFCLKKPNLLWSEIDNEMQLMRAKNLYHEIT